MAGKNLVVCCDGTNNEFGDTNTNVVRTFTVAVKQTGKQHAFYDPGLGTFPSPGAITPIAQGLTKLAGSAAGFGLSQNVALSYKFLMENYEDGDQIYLFGFSRGAYTVRVVAALMHACGLMTRDNANLIPYAFNLFRNETSKRGKHGGHTLELPICDQFKAAFSRAVPIHFIGVWDTVSSVGNVYDPFKLPFTKTNPSVKTLRHAISIDEKRKFFRTNLWSNPSPSTPTDVVQVWFAGVHADVGGGYPEVDCGLSKISFQWMMEEAGLAGMQIDKAKLEGMLPPADHTPPAAPANPLAMQHDELLKLMWKVAQWVPRKQWRVNEKTHQWEEYWNFSPRHAPRPISEGSRVHRTVFERMAKNKNYMPPNVPKDVCDEKGNKVAW